MKPPGYWPDRHPPLLARVLTLLDRLDDRLEAQVLLPGADEVHCTAMVGLFHTAAGRAERRFDTLGTARGSGYERLFATEIRVLRRIVHTHGVMVRERGAELRLREARKGAT